MLKGVSYISLIIFMLSLVSCGVDRSESIPDVSDIEVDYDIYRVDELIHNIDTSNLAVGIEKFQSTYPKFYDIYFQHVLPIVGDTEDQFQENLKGYLTDKRVRRLLDTVDMVFDGIEDNLKKDFDQAFKLMKHYYPDFEAPNVYTYTAEYAIQQFLFEDADGEAAAIGLDLYLGETYPYKKIDPQEPAFSSYLTRSFNKDHIVRNVMDLIISDRLGVSNGSRLLDQMIHNGKRIYLLDKVLPMVHDSVILKYNKDQTEWVKDNELEMWAFFFDQDLFYESNSMKINKYVNPSPDSPGMPRSAPGETGNYMGLQIIKQYMDRYPETTIKELFDMTDAQELMTKSRYKPKRK